MTASAKPWWQSKTIWFNAATGMVAVGIEAAPLVGFLPVETQDSVRIALAALVAVGNIVLRVITDRPVSR